MHIGQLAEAGDGLYTVWFFRRASGGGEAAEAGNGGALAQVGGGRAESVKQRSFRETMLCGHVDFKIC